MTPALLFPLALAAFAAAVVPLAIHLARASEQRPTDFAALRWLRQKPRPRHRLRFDEKWLLASRLLLLALLALWLAAPVLFDSADTRAVVAVVPGVDPAQVAPRAEARTRWLAPGFPDIADAPPTGSLPIASLVRQLDAELPPGVPLTIVVPAVLDGIDAERPRMSRAVDWRIVPGAMPERAVTPVASQALTVRYARTSGLRYFRAVAAAWGPGTRYAAAPVAEPIPAGTRTLVWLASGPVPQAVQVWTARGGTLMLDAAAAIDREGMTPWWRDPLGTTLVEGKAAGRGRILRFTRPLVPEAMPALLEPDFPAQVQRLLADPAPPPTRAFARDVAPVTGGAAYPQPARDLRPWLALLIATVLLVERWLATRRRGVAP